MSLVLKTTQGLSDILTAAAAYIAQTDKPPAARTPTARTYGAALDALGVYVSHLGNPTPSRIVLEKWRDDMLAGGLSVSTVNTRLSAARRWLRLAADMATDITIKLVLRDVANVENAKSVTIQDKTHEDYGVRLELSQLMELLSLPDTSNVKGLRDRAAIALLAGAGLRVSELCALTVGDVLNVVSDGDGLHGVRVRRGKHNKSRVVVVGERSHFVFRAIDAYLAVAPAAQDVLLRGVAKLPSGRLVTTQNPITARAVQAMLKGYVIPSLGRAVATHDLRRTYGYLCQRGGMAWDALRENMGHSSIVVTEGYVGRAVRWAHRVPAWQIDL